MSDQSKVLLSQSDIEWEDDGWDDDDLECTHCGGEGICYAGADPLGNCPDDIHRCHACHGSGKRKDQVIF